MATNPYIENYLDLHKFIIDSGASQLDEDAIKQDNFKDIIKDINLGYFTEREIMTIRFVEELTGYCMIYGAKKSTLAFLRDIFVIIATSRGRGGFERRMVATQIQEAKHEIKGDPTKLMQKLGLGRKKEGGV